MVVLFFAIVNRSSSYHLLLYVKLQFLDIFICHYFKEHILLLIFLFTESALFRFLNSWKLIKVIEVLYRPMQVFIFQFFIINFLFLSQELIWIINQSFRSIQIIQPILKLRSLFTQISFKIRNDRFSVRVFEVKHILLVLIIVLHSERLKSKLLSNILSFLFFVFGSLF